MEKKKEEGEEGGVEGKKKNKKGKSCGEYSPGNEPLTLTW